MWMVKNNDRNWKKLNEIELELNFERKKTVQEMNNKRNVKELANIVDNYKTKHEIIWIVQQCDGNCKQIRMINDWKWFKAPIDTWTFIYFCIGFNKILKAPNRLAH